MVQKIGHSPRFRGGTALARADAQNAPSSTSISRNNMESVQQINGHRASAPREGAGLAWRRFARFRATVASVRFGIVLLGLLLGCCVVGMLVVQQDAGAFAEYFASLSPSQKTLYGALG